jgi:glutaredoxin
MAEPQGKSSEKPWTQQATEKLAQVLNRADELGGELRDYIQERVVADPRYVQARKKLAGLLGLTYESHAEAADKAQAQAAKVAQAAAVTPSVGEQKKAKTAGGFGDPSIKAQLFGTRSCPWTGRAITLLERHKVDFDFVDLDEPEHEAKRVPLTAETKQNTVPYVYLRGKFVGGFNALSEVERLGQLEVALMSAEERAAAPAHVRSVEIVARPNTDEVAPAESDPAE